VKIGVPEGVAENDIGSAVDALLVRGMKEAAQIGLNSQGIEVISAGKIGPDSGGISAGIDSHRANDLGRREAFKGPVAVAQIQIVRVGLRWAAVPLHYIETLRVWQVNGAQHQCVQDAEHDGISADAECE